MRKYCWEDFIEDDSFFAAAKRNDQLYLNNVLLYLKDYPQQSKMAEEAFAFISALKIVKKNILVEDIDEEFIPKNSLLREFIGGSIFEY